MAITSKIASGTLLATYKRKASNGVKKALSIEVEETVPDESVKPTEVLKDASESDSIASLNANDTKVDVMDSNTATAIQDLAKQTSPNEGSFLHNDPVHDSTTDFHKETLTAPDTKPGLNASQTGHHLDSSLTSGGIESTEGIGSTPNGADVQRSYKANLKDVFESSEVKLDTSEIELRYEEVPVFVPLSLLRPNPRNSRKTYPQDVIDNLADSIRDNGLKIPIQIACKSFHDGYYYIIEGHTRLEALKKLNIDKIPCILKTSVDALNDYEMFAAGFIVNMMRRGVAELDQGIEFVNMIEAKLATYEDLEKITGFSKKTLYNITSNIRNIPDELKDHIIQGGFDGFSRKQLEILKSVANKSMKHAKLLASESALKKFTEQTMKKRATEYLKEIAGSLVENKTLFKTRSFILENETKNFVSIIQKKQKVSFEINPKYEELISEVEKLVLIRLEEMGAKEKIKGPDEL